MKGDINPEILSTVPTHFDRNQKVNVKVFNSTKAEDTSGKVVYTAEIMEGPHKGKWTTVWEEHLESPVKWKKFEELSKVEVALRNLVYAYKTKDNPIPNCPFPDGSKYYLELQVIEAEELMKEMGIRLVELGGERE